MLAAMEYDDHEYYQEGEFSKEPDVVWSGIGRKIPVIVFYASLLDIDIKERQLLTGNFRLTFKTGKTDCKIVRSLLQAHGFIEVHPSSSHFNLFWTGSHVKPYDLRCYGEYQKVNHFPRSYEITRKDRLGKNVQRMQQTKGFKSFNFIPKTYVIPEEYHQYIGTFTKEQGIWIVKPIASSRGRGIFLVNHPSQIPTEDPMVVSKYIDNPLCIDGFKFDVRLYVAVTSYYPLRIYMFEEGLTRFATVRYNGAGRNLHNQRMHLTNYSINKKSTEYVRCEDPTVEDYGNKWSMSAMLRFLEEEGKDVAMLMSRVEDVVIKTVISGELPIAGACKAFMNQKTNCFEVYGFDILIDENLYPWLLEVNLSPSLACDAPLDFRIKSNLVADLLSLVGIVVQDTYSGEVKRKQKDSVAECKNRVKPILCSSNLDSYKLNYTAENMRTVREAREEYERKGKFVRIFPRVDTWDLYGSYLEHKAINYTLHCQLFPDRIKSRSTIGITKGRIRSQQFREQVSLPEVNIAALHKRMDQYKRVLTIKLKLKETIPLRVVICGRLSHTGLEVCGLGAGALHQSTLCVEKRSDIEQCHTTVKSEAVGMKKLVGSTQQVNPELLSKIQARHVFAAYLEHVQRRLIKETSYIEEKFQHDSDPADIDLIIKFLRKAASNLRGNFQVIEPSLHIPVRDRCRILAKQLAEFVALYKKETVQYEHREKMYGVYVMKNPKQEISEEQFHLFVKEANESILEKTLMLYTKANRATNAFLSAAYPTASQENESESASVAGSAHSSCTSLVGSEASRHITGQSSDSSESECLSDPPAVKTTTFQSRKLCRTLSADPCRKKTTTSLRDCRPSSVSGRRNYSQPQIVLDRSISPLSSANMSNSRSNLHSTGISEHSHPTVSGYKQTKPEPRLVLGKQLNQESISVALNKLARKQNSRKYSATLATKVGIHSKSLVNPERNTTLHLAEVTPLQQGDKHSEEVSRLNSQFFVPTPTRTGTQLLRSQSKPKKDIVQVQSFSDVSTDMSPSSEQQLRLQAHARAIAHQYLLQKKQIITGKDHIANRNTLYPSHKW